MEQEIWKDVIGYEGIYIVSNLANVKSLSRIVKAGRASIVIEEKLLKQTLEKSGYLKVGLSYRGHMRTARIHKLVARHFVGDYTLIPNHFICHKDGNRLNNCASNLYIGDVVSNTLDRYKQSRTKVTPLQVLEIRKSKETTIALGKKYGVNRTYISYIKSGKLCRHIDLLFS